MEFQSLVRARRNASCSTERRLSRAARLGRRAARRLVRAARAARPRCRVGAGPRGAAGIAALSPRRAQGTRSQGRRAESFTAERRACRRTADWRPARAQILQLLREAEDRRRSTRVARAQTVLRSLSELDRASPIAKAIDESRLRARRLRVRCALRGPGADPQRQEWVEPRLAAMEAVARKHRIEPRPSALRRGAREGVSELDTLEPRGAPRRQLAQLQRSSTPPAQADCRARQRARELDRARHAS